MFAAVLLSLLAGAAGFDGWTALVIKDTYDGSEYDVGQWGPISVSSDGTKAVAATNGYGATSDFVWVSTDGGTTFTKTSEMANEVVITRDGSKMFAVRIDYSARTSGHKIRHSSDGTTWADTAADSTVKWSCLAVSSDGTKMVAGGWDGNLWTSSDTGATWTDTGVGPQQWHGLAMSGDGTKIAAGTNGNKIWISTDSGSTFAEAASSQATKWRALAMTTDGSKIAAASQQGGVWSSSDNGATWTEGLAADSAVYRGVAISDDGMTIVANNCCGGTNRISTNGGTSFGYLDNTLNKYWERIAITGDASKVMATASQDAGRLYTGALASTTTTTTTTSTTTTTTTMAFDGTFEMYLGDTCTGDSMTANIYLDVCLPFTKPGSTTPASNKFTCASGSITRMRYPDGVIDCRGTPSITEGPLAQGTCATSEDGFSGIFQVATCTAGGSTNTPTVVEVTLTLTVDDAAAITGSTAVQTAMIASFASLMNVDASTVTLTFQAGRRLDDRRLQSTLLAIFSVTTPSPAAAAATRTIIEATDTATTSSQMAAAATGAGYTGSLTVTTKTSAVKAQETSSGATSGSAIMQMAALGVMLLHFF